MVLFGLFLVYTGIRMAMEKEKRIDPGESSVVRWICRFFPVTRELHGSRFFVTVDGIRHVTPLLIVLLFLETTDVMFAVDSVPAARARAALLSAGVARRHARRRGGQFRGRRHPLRKGLRSDPRPAAGALRLPGVVLDSRKDWVFGVPAIPFQLQIAQDDLRPRDKLFYQLILAHRLQVLLQRK